MPEYDVIVTAEYTETAPSPKEAIKQALSRSDRPERLTVRADGDDA